MRRSSSDGDLIHLRVDLNTCRVSFMILRLCSFLLPAPQAPFLKKTARYAPKPKTTNTTNKQKLISAILKVAPSELSRGPITVATER